MAPDGRTTAFGLGARLIGLFAGLLLFIAGTLVTIAISIAIVVMPLIAALEQFEVSPTLIYDPAFLNVFVNELVTYFVHAIPAVIVLIIVEVIAGSLLASAFD